MVKRITGIFIFSLLPAAIFMLLFSKGNITLIIFFSSLFFAISFISGRINTALNAGKQCLWCGKEVAEEIAEDDKRFSVCREKEMEGLLKFSSFIYRRKALIWTSIAAIALLYGADLFFRYSEGSNAITNFLLRVLTGAFLIIVSSLHNKETPLQQEQFNKVLPSISILCPPGINVSLWTLKVCGVLILIIESDKALPAISRLLALFFPLSYLS